MLSKKVSLGAAITMVGVGAAITVSITYVYAMNSFNGKMADVNERQAMYTKLSEIDQKARQDYIGTIDEKKLEDSICAGYVAGLGDTQAKYMTAEKYKAYMTSTNAKSVGVGIRTFQDDDGNMEVMEVMPNSPAEKSGIKKGDVIIAMDDKEIVRLTYGDALNKLDGMAGTNVKFNILRPAETADAPAQTMTITVTRGEYTQQTITSAIINGNVGYVRITQFNESTGQQFNTELNKLSSQNVVGLVIDLRNNAGGSMEAAANALDTILPAGTTVSSKDKAGNVTVEYTSKSNEIAIPVCVIVNGSTYGAAEIFAADVRDYKKGLVVGDKTAGHGTKDQVIALSDGSAISISVANYLTLNGTPFTGVGITPDVNKSLTSEQSALLSRLQLTVKDDPQVQAGVSALMRQGSAVAEPPGGAAQGDGGDAPAAEPQTAGDTDSLVQSAPQSTAPAS